MRDLVVFVADSTMEHAFRSFLTRPDFHAPYNLNIQPIDFDPAEDLIRIPGTILAPLARAMSGCVRVWANTATRPLSLTASSGPPGQRTNPSR